VTGGGSSTASDCGVRGDNSAVQDNLFFFNARLDAVRVLGERLRVGVDIRSDAARNVVNLRSEGVVAVAIFGSAAFDVAEIDATTLAFGPAGPPRHRRWPEHAGT
jgi:hypothetical protein